MKLNRFIFIYILTFGYLGFSNLMALNPFKKVKSMFSFSSKYPKENEIKERSKSVQPSSSDDENDSPTSIKISRDSDYKDISLRELILGKISFINNSKIKVKLNLNFTNGCNALNVAICRKNCGELSKNLNVVEELKKSLIMTNNLTFYEEKFLDSFDMDIILENNQKLSEEIEEIIFDFNVNISKKFSETMFFLEIEDVNEFDWKGNICGFYVDYLGKKPIYDEIKMREIVHNSIVAHESVLEFSQKLEN